MSFLSCHNHTSAVQKQNIAMDLYLLSCRIKIFLQHGDMVSEHTSERGGDQFEVNSELLNGEEQGRLLN